MPLARARDQLGEIVNRVAYSGERVTLSRRGRPLAVLISVADLATLERNSHGPSVGDRATIFRHADAGISVPSGDVAAP